MFDGCLFREKRFVKVASTKHSFLYKFKFILLEKKRRRVWLKEGLNF